MTSVEERAIRFAMARPAPALVPGGRGDRTRAQDYFSVYLGPIADDYPYLVTGITAHGVNCLYLREGTYEVECAIPYHLLKRIDTDFRHYLHGYEFRTLSPWWFLIRQSLSLSRLEIVRDRLTQWVFNQRDLVRADRMRVLRWMFDKTMEDGDFHATATSLLTHRHSLRWVAHPASQQSRIYYQLLLDSLVESADVRCDRHSYRLAPRALHTLSEYEAAQRRNTWQNRQQSIVIILTIVLAIVGALQAWATYLAVPSPPPHQAASHGD